MKSLKHVIQLNEQFKNVEDKLQLIHNLKINETLMVEALPSISTNVMENFEIPDRCYILAIKTLKDGSTNVWFAYLRSDAGSDDEIIKFRDDQMLNINDVEEGFIDAKHKLG
ncbi:MAG: hypothetical protein V3U19_03690 [Thermodesulfobacteriota bacterium]